MQKLTLLLFLFFLVLATSCNKRVHQSILTIPSKKEINQAQTPVYVGEVSDIQIPPKPTHSKAHFDAAFREITAMLEGGKTGLDFKRAVFLTENAYLNQQLDYGQFETVIDQMADFCRVIQESTVLDEPYELEDREEMMRNLAIYRFMADTLKIQESDTSEVSDSFSSFSILPYQYNFKDFAGQADWTNTFVSKLIATGQGNCRSMPYLYKILAEEMDAPAYFCLTPNHLYLTHPNEKVGWYNTELTSGSFPKDAWLMAAGYVPLEGIQSGIYMKNLTETEEIALTLVDLAQAYQARFGKDHNPEFVLQCTEKALAYFPLCINAQLLQAQALSDLYETDKNPLTFQRLEELCRSILDLGYIPPPQEAVVASLQNGQADKYQSNSTTTPYFQNTSNQRNDDKFAKNALTLSNGRYDEFLELEVLVQIGKAVFDTEQDRIVSWVKQSEKLPNLESIIGRWLSIDPLAKKFPSMSPYNSFNNNPIYYADPDGREVIITIIRQGDGKPTLIKIHYTAIIVDDSYKDYSMEQGKELKNRIIAATDKWNRKDIEGYEISVTHDIKIFDNKNGKVGNADDYENKQKRSFIQFDDEELDENTLASAARSAKYMRVGSNSITSDLEKVVFTLAHEFGHWFGIILHSDVLAKRKNDVVNDVDTVQFFIDNFTSEELEEMGWIISTYYEETKDDEANLMRTKTSENRGYNLVPGQIKDIENAKPSEYRKIQHEPNEENDDN